MTRNKKEGKILGNYYTLTLGIITTKSDEKTLDRYFKAKQRIMNANIKYYRNVIENQYYKDENFIKNHQRVLELCVQKETEKDKSVIKKLDAEIKKLRKENLILASQKYKLTNFNIQERCWQTAKLSYNGMFRYEVASSFGIDIFNAVSKVLNAQKKEVHFKRLKDINSIKSKKATSGIIYNSKDNTVKFCGKYIFRVKKIPTKDIFAMQCFENGKLKFCTISRVPSKNGFRYNLILTFEGEKPIKTRPVGTKHYGIDLGISQIAYASQDGTDLAFIKTSPKTEEYDEKIKKLSQKLERSRRANNPECYNEDGTSIKGKKQTKNSNTYIKTQKQLNGIYEKKKAYVKNFNNQIANIIASKASSISIEPMDYAELGTKQEGKISFGKGIHKNSPAQLANTLKQKIVNNGGEVIEVNGYQYKASQYNHVSDTYTKPDLSERTKNIGEHIVQRDLYSAFILANLLDKNTINRNGAIKYFDTFIHSQNILVTQLKSDKKNVSENFGLNKF